MSYIGKVYNHFTFILYVFLSTWIISQRINAHIKGHREQIMKELNELKWMNSLDASKVESMAPAISQLIYDYAVPADHHD